MPVCSPSEWDQMLYHALEWLPGVCAGAGVRLFWGSFGFSQGYLARWVTPWCSDWVIAWRARRQFAQRSREPVVARNVFTFDANRIGSLLCHSLSGRVEQGRYKVWLTTACNRTELVSITVTLVPDAHGSLVVREAPGAESAGAEASP
jgi:hypothetical protein